MYIHMGVDDYIHYIIKQTRSHNIDNISRTKAYQSFYFSQPDIKWALLASVVSRNAGWNMTDLLLPPYMNMLSDKEIRWLFMTYERANWLIFSDAYPQLLVYKWSQHINKPMFNVLHAFHVSSFIIKEWEHFWHYRDLNRLMTAQIINEQNVIEGPVIAQSFFKEKVFHDIPYVLQNLLGMNAVILPTRSTTMYEYPVKAFTHVTKRIQLGKKLALALFDTSVYPDVIDFVRHIEHTGSRRDYERYVDVPFPYAPPLRCAYPIIQHNDHVRRDWYSERDVKPKWRKPINVDDARDFSSTFYQKRHLLFIYNHMKHLLKANNPDQ
ncbi:DUF2515 family protein [Lentibacillus saliphilus]|uniref:DUF2515 family protein n=1 Tax=Lentibacillus saliphilus TaxID=2737028 RepID=UPI001C309483|nr:DUF2515 family protein [Lentibacillus saliphilus]